MSNIDVIRAWKDKDYRDGLSEEEKAQLPAHPAGLIELTDEDMSSMAGGVMVADVAAHTEGAGCHHTETCEHCKTLAL